MKILVTEDDPQLLKIITSGLKAEGYLVEHTSEGEEALWLVENGAYDLIVMDVNLPGLDGFSIVKRMRHKGNQTPVIFMTGRSGEQDRLTGFDAGGDDYLTKPISILELFARIRALMRRMRPSQVQSVLKVGDLALDLITHQARYGGETIDLTNREFTILEILMSASPKPVSKAALMERGWHSNLDYESKLVNVHVCNLRKKLAGPGRPPMLQTLKGVGFCVKPPEGPQKEEKSPGGEASARRGGKNVGTAKRKQKRA